MKFRYKMIKIVSAAALAASLGLWSPPCSALAASPGEKGTDNSVEFTYGNAGDENMESGKTGEYSKNTPEEPENIEQPENAEEAENAEKPENTEKTEEGPSDGDNSGNVEEITEETDDGQEIPAEVPFYMKDPATGIVVEADAGIVPAGVIAVIVPMEGREEAEQLGQFMALSSDRYTAYYITLIDFMTMTPVVPSGDLKITIPVPEGYDRSRVVVSAIVLEGETPQRTELAADLADGTAVFVTDQPGLFAVMEKKVLPELPSALEMTAKVDKLQLTSGYRNMSLTSSYTASSSITAGPATGDETNAVTWAVAAAAAAAAVVVIIIIRNRKR